MISDKVKRVIIGTLIFTIIINQKFPYLHIKHERNVTIQSIDNSKQDIKLSGAQYIDNFDNEKIEEYKLHRQEIVKTEEEKKKENAIEWINIRLSYYTNSYSDCGKTDAISASGKNLIKETNKNLSRGSMKITYIATPKSIPFGTQMYIEGLGYCESADNGSAIYFDEDGTMRVDVFIPNASSKEIKKKGVVYTKGYKLNNKIIN